MGEVILETSNQESSSRSKLRNKLQDSSEVKTEKNPRPKKRRKLLTEDEFYSIIQEELRKKGVIIPSNIVFARAKDMTLEERRKEAGKPLYISRYE
jgi:integrase